MAMTFSPVLQTALQAALAKGAACVVDEDVMMAPLKPEQLEPVFRLTWIDAGLHDAPPGALATEYERTRDFLYLGAAIAWSRRRIFHGHVFGDAIEMSEVLRTKMRDGSISEDVSDPIEITLPGFVRWKKGDTYGDRQSYRTGKVERRCTWEE